MLKNNLCHGGTPITNKHDHLSEEAPMYYSRQQAMFDSALNQKFVTKKSKISIDNIKLHHIERIQDYLSPDQCKEYLNTFKRLRIKGNNDNISKDSHEYHTNYEMNYGRFVTNDQYVIFDNIRDDSSILHKQTARAFVQAGPRKYIPWKPYEVRAAIVTCGGLCPGLNNVIQEIFYSLYYNYGVDTIYGIRCGYRGFFDKNYQPWLKLTPEYVANIHDIGGTLLGASRGGFDAVKIINACEVYGINQLYIIGGDGTHRGANELYKECKKRSLKLTIACIPKTIDNDIGVIDRSFGFNTAVAEARKAINSVVVEAKCTPNGIGIVKLMGRHAGYIAAHATLSSRQVDVCLVPEVPFHLLGVNGLLTHIQRALEVQQHCVIVVAEGAGIDLMNEEAVKDESGNIKLGDIGQFLTKKISLFMKSQKINASIKYVDPSYMIRSVPADAEDSVYCLFLASHAVHGAMAGYTGFSVGLCTGRSVYIPIDVIVTASPSYLNPKGSTWERILALTHQPNWSDKPVEIKTEKDQVIQDKMEKLDNTNITSKL